MKPNLEELREENKLLTDALNDLRDYLKKANEEAKLWENAYHGQLQAILKNLDGKLGSEEVALGIFMKEKIDPRKAGRICSLIFIEIKEMLEGKGK